MQEFEFKVKIEAQSYDEAKKILNAMFDLMITTRHQLSTSDFLNFSAKVKANPKLINKAKMFI